MIGYVTVSTSDRVLSVHKRKCAVDGTQVIGQSIYFVPSLVCTLRPSTAHFHLCTDRTLSLVDRWSESNLPVGDSNMPTEADWMHSRKDRMRRSCSGYGRSKGNSKSHSSPSETAEGRVDIISADIHFKTKTLFSVQIHPNVWNQLRTPPIPNHITVYYLTDADTLCLSVGFCVKKYSNSNLYTLVRAEKFDH